MNDEIIRVLLVEDSDAEAAVYGDYLKSSQFGRFEVIRVALLASAIDLLKKNVYDVVILDLVLPDSTGVDTFMTISPLAVKAGIIVLTGTDNEALALNALKLGAQDYQLKGQVNEKEFVRVVRYALERKRFQEVLREKTEELEAQAWGLKKTNESIRVLYKELEKKTAEVERRAQQLKVFHEASVGREDRILELKKEVARLTQRLEVHDKPV